MASKVNQDHLTDPAPAYTWISERNSTDTPVKTKNNIKSDEKPKSVGEQIYEGFELQLRSFTID